MLDASDATTHASHSTSAPGALEQNLQAAEVASKPWCSDDAFTGSALTRQTTMASAVPLAELPPRSKLIEVVTGKLSVAHATLSAITTELQEGRASHEEAAYSFGILIRTLPVGKLRGCALLNRAHCLVALGRNEQALFDVDSIVADSGAPGMEALSWPKVWMSRGHILRKLGEASMGPAAADFRGRALQDFEHVAAISGTHVAKAQKCVEQLREIDRRLRADAAVDIIEDLDVAPQSPTRKFGPCRCDPPQGEIARSPEKMLEGLSRAVFINALPVAATMEMLRSEFTRHGPIEDVVIEPDGNSAMRRGIITFSSRARATRIVQEMGGSVHFLGLSLACKLELGRDRGSSEHDACHLEGKRRRLECQTDRKVTGLAHAANIDIDFAQTALQALGTACTAAGRTILEQGDVTFVDPKVSTEGLCAFQVKSPVGIERVTLYHQGPSPGHSFGECSCRLHGHCKHVAAALLLLIGESSAMDAFARHRLVNSSNQQARQPRSFSVCRLTGLPDR